MALSGLEWLKVALYGLVAFMTMYGLIRQSIDLFSILSSCMALYGLVWPCYGPMSHFMVFYGRILSFLAVIDQNSFGLVMSQGTFPSFLEQN